MEITAENMEDIKELIEHGKLPVEALIGHEPDRELVHILKCSRKDNGRWFEVGARVGKEWVDPYFAFLAELTGYTGDMPEIEAPNFDAKYWRHITPQCIVISAKIDRQGHSRVGFVSESDWQGRKAENRAQPHFLEILQNDIGYTKPQQQYIPVGEWGTTFRLNPNWGTYRPPEPIPRSELTHRSVYMDCLMEWWLANEATTQQREHWRRAEKCYHNTCPMSSLAASLANGYRKEIAVTWGNSDENLTYKQFQRLGKT